MFSKYISSDLIVFNIMPYCDIDTINKYFEKEKEKFCKNINYFIPIKINNKNLDFINIFKNYINNKNNFDFPNKNIQQLLSTFPTFDLCNQEGYSDYIDFIIIGYGYPTHYRNIVDNTPIIIGKDKHNRIFISLIFEITYGNNSIPFYTGQTIFQRYRNDRGSYRGTRLNFFNYANELWSYSDHTFADEINDNILNFIEKLLINYFGDNVKIPITSEDIKNGIFKSSLTNEDLIKDIRIINNCKNFCFFI